jgi:hypothetical protein
VPSVSYVCVGHLFQPLPLCPPVGARMLDRVYHYIEHFTRVAAQLDRQHWIVLSVMVLLLGLVCMRGFGSRVNY